MLVSKNTIQERKSGYFLFGDTKKTWIVSGKDANLLREAIILNPYDESMEVKGQVAYPGKTRGPARIVMTITELYKVEQGDILVTTSTTPDYVPILKKVKAIVTEEGGVLSHASVISRELHIPCVIGTKIATKKIKDGDLIEVDAQKGVVKILSSSSDNQVINQEVITKLLPSIQSNKYTLWATRFYSAVFNQGFCEYSIQNGAKEIFAVPIGDDKADYVVRDPEFDLACHTIGIDFMKKSSELLEDYETIKKKVLSISEDISSKAGKIPDIELKKIYLEYWKVSMQFQPYLMFPHYMERELEPEVRRRFLPHFELISSLGRPTEHMKMQKMLFEEPPAAVAKEYGWLNVYGMTEKPFDEAYFKDYKNILKEKEVFSQLETIKKNDLQFNAFVKTIPAKEQEICKALHAFVYIRTDRIDVWKKHASLLYPFIQYVVSKISKNLGIREGSMLLREEVVRILSGKTPVSEQELTMRGKRTTDIIYYSESCSMWLSDERINDALHQAYTKKQEAEIVRGTPAFSGIVQGRARIYLHAKDIQDEEKGYVMICKHTSPQDLPYMKRAIAIVTDEGGITCHAAIVSRELKIPAIVGTKHATQVLKDGDLVEVDAKNGIVRKIR